MKMYSMLSLAFSVLGGAHALAADLPSKAPAFAPIPYVAPSWTGLYVGVNAGGGWTSHDEDVTGTNRISSAIISAGAIPSKFDTRGGGALVGGTVGYNYQINNFVVGAEGDIDYAHIGGSDSQALIFGPFALSSHAETRLNWLATLRGRAGYLVTPGTLVYATGGGAVGGIHNSTSASLSTPIPGLNASATGDGSATKWGWTVGGGIEQQINAKLSLKAEYGFVDLGNVGSTFGATVFRTPIGFTTRDELRYHTVRVGLNYHF